LASALRRVPSSSRRATPFRGVPLAPRRGLARGRTPSEEGLLPRVVLRRWTSSPPPCPDPRVGSGCEVAARSGRCPAAVGFPSEEGHRRTAGWLPGGGCPAAVGVPSEEGCRRDRWRAAVAAARLLSGSHRSGDLQAAGWPPGACGLGARAVAARPRGGGWLARDAVSRSAALRGGGGRSDPLAARRRGVGWPAVPPLPASEEVGFAGPPVTIGLDRSEERRRPGVFRGSPAFRRRWIRVWWTISLAVLPPRRAEARRFDCVPAPEGQAPSVCFGPSAKPRLRFWSAAAGPCAWDRSAPAEAGSGWPAAPLLPSPEGPGCPVAAPPGRSRVVMASSLSRPGKPSLVQASLSHPLANQRLPWGRLPRPLTPRPKPGGFLPWRRDRRPS